MTVAKSLLLCLCLLLFALRVTAQETVPAEPAQGDPAATIPIEQLPVPDYNPGGTEPGAKEKEFRGYQGPSILFDMLGKLLVVLGLILLMAWLAQKYLPRRLGVLGEGKQLKLIQNLPLGQRRFLSLVEADGKRYLLGVTDNQINLIKALDELQFEQALSGIDTPKTVQELWEETQ